MKLKLFAIGLGMAIALALQACGGRQIQPSSDIETTTLSVDSFTSIDIATPITVNITQADRQSVEVNCPTNLIEFLEVKVSRGTLIAHLKSGCNIKGKSNITINLTAPRLSEITICAASKVNINGTYSQPEELALEASSASNIAIDSLFVTKLDVEAYSASHITIAEVQTPLLDVEAHSAASVTLAGKAGDAYFEAHSAGSIHAKALSIDDLKRAEVSSAAHINLN